jgi:hypothetical protein
MTAIQRLAGADELHADRGLQGEGLVSIRFFIIYVGLISVISIIVVFITGPVWGLRLDYERGQHIQLLQIATPTFLSYLSAAVAYASVGASFPEPRGERGQILRTVAVGGAAIFGIGFIVCTTVYYLSARGQLPNSALKFDQYTNLVTMLLGVLGATTSAVATFVFAAKKQDQNSVGGEK